MIFRSFHFQMNNSVYFFFLFFFLLQQTQNTDRLANALLSRPNGVAVLKIEHPVYVYIYVRVECERKRVKLQVIESNWSLKKFHNFQNALNQ